MRNVNLAAVMAAVQKETLDRLSDKPLNAWDCAAAGFEDPVAIADMLKPRPATKSLDKRKSLPTHASYLEPLIMTPKVAISRFLSNTKGLKFDTLIGTGLSGALAVPLFARAKRCKFAIVRKKGDGTHSCKRIEGVVGRRWIFVDDLICSGATKDRVQQAMKEFCAEYDWETEYLGDYLFFNPRFEAHVKEPT